MEGKLLMFTRRIVNNAGPVLANQIAANTLRCDIIIEVTEASPIISQDIGRCAVVVTRVTLDSSFRTPQTTRTDCSSCKAI